jgi:hypothetical protein
MGSSSSKLTPILKICIDDMHELDRLLTSFNSLQEISKVSISGKLIRGNFPLSLFRWRFRCCRWESYNNGVMSSIPFYRRYNSCMLWNAASGYIVVSLFYHKLIENNADRFLTRLRMDRSCRFLEDSYRLISSLPSSRSTLFSRLMHYNIRLIFGGSKGMSIIRANFF